MRSPGPDSELFLDLLFSPGVYASKPVLEQSSRVSNLQLAQKKYLFKFTRLSIAAFFVDKETQARLARSASGSVVAAS